VKIVGDQEDRRSGAENRTRDRVEQPLALFVGWERRRRAGYLWQDATELAQPSGIEPHASGR
jgi:hypothetical protein